MLGRKIFIHFISVRLTPGSGEEGDQYRFIHYGETSLANFVA